MRIVVSGAASVGKMSKRGGVITMVERIRKITEDQIQKMIFIGLVAVMFVLPLPQLFLPEDKRAIAMKTSSVSATVLPMEN